MTQKPLSLYGAMCAGMIAALTPVAALALSDAEAEADSIVEAEFSAQIARQAERRAKILEVPAIRETAVRHGDQTVLVRRVAPPPRIHLEETEPEEGEDSPLTAIDQKPEINLTLFAEVGAMSDVSEIRSRDPGSGNEYTVIGEIVFLPPFVTVETPEARYTFFSLVSQTDEIVAAPAHASFSSEGSGYTIYSDSSSISESFESAIAALREHYLERREEWKAEAERAKMLEAARERYRAQNAQNPPPRKTTINIWRADRVSDDPE